MKMIGKLNEKDLKINKTDDFVDVRNTGAVILLMVFIVKVEPPAEYPGRSSQSPGSGF
ncbi:MAG: hypothetical protein ACLT0W_04570 [Clostridium sp.]